MNTKYFALAALIAVGIAASLEVAQSQETPVAATQPAASTRPGVTLINLHMKQAMAEDAFDELAKQAGVKLANNGNMWAQDSMQEPMDVDITDKPFWPAMRQLCGMWNMSIQQNFGNNSGRRIMLYPMNQMQGRDPSHVTPSCQSEGFVIEAISFNRQQVVNYAQQWGVGINYCNLQLKVYVDPSLRVANFSPSVKADEAMDDAGNSMLPGKETRPNYGSNQQRSMIYDCSVALKYPDKAGKKIAILKGSIPIRVSNRVDVMTIDKPLEAGETSKTFGDTTVTFHSMKKTAQGNAYQVKVSIAYDGEDSGNNELMSLVQSGSQLWDDKGKSFMFSGGGGNGGGNGDEQEFTATYSHMNGGDDDSAHGEPAKWMIEIPSGVHTIKVPFEFKDLPLP